ncbi:MAG: phasin [Salinarimonadaceae bacterium]|nr:MAG: phasin [Salinarimonadaceae bacterium]
MTNKPNDNIPAFEVPAEVREIAERSVDQARKAMDGFVAAAGKAFDTLDGSASTAGASMKDMRAKSFSYAEKNLQAAFDHAQKLVRAKDPTEAMRLQSEFMQSQFEEMRKQMSEFGAAAQAGVTEAAKEATKAATPKK